MLLAQAEKKIDPRVKRTRDLLQQAMLELMLEKSVQAITVQDIAERATLNRATFYAHFADKQALLEHTLREMFRQRLVSQLSEDSPFNRETLGKLILTVSEFLAEVGSHCPPPHTEYEPLMEKQIKAELCQVIGRWLAQPPAGRSARRADPELAATMTAWAIYGAAHQWSNKERPEPASQFVQQVLPIILAGLDSTVKVR